MSYNSLGIHVANLRLKGFAIKRMVVYSVGALDLDDRLRKRCDLLGGGPGKLGEA
jgi:hypothetical protein